MGTMDQPKPTEPKATTRDPEPLQPGQTPSGDRDRPSPLESNPKQNSDSGPIGDEKR